MSANQLRLVDYTAKSIAVVGETKAFKEALKELGGRWNPNLTVGQGWIFPMSSKDKVSKFVQSVSTGEAPTATSPFEATSEISHTEKVDVHPFLTKYRYTSSAILSFTGYNL